MKKLSSGIAALSLLSMIACNDAPKTATTATATTTTTPKNWDLVITSMTTKHQLDSVSAAWAKDSIDFKITKFENDSTGKLAKVAGDIKMTFVKAGMSGSFNSDSIKWKPFKIKMSNQPRIELSDKK